MALKIRLRQQGRNNRPFYRVVITDVRSPRDGKYVEALGWYNPFEDQEDRGLSIKGERVQYWIEQGAEVSDSVRSILARATPAVAKQLTDQSVSQRSRALAKRKARAKRKAAAPSQK